MNLLSLRLVVARKYVRILFSTADTQYSDIREGTKNAAWKPYYAYITHGVVLTSNTGCHLHLFTSQSTHNSSRNYVTAQQDRF